MNAMIITTRGKTRAIDLSLSVEKVSGILNSLEHFKILGYTSIDLEKQRLARKGIKRNGTGKRKTSSIIKATLV